LKIKKNVTWKVPKEKRSTRRTCLRQLNRCEFATPTREPHKAGTDPQFVHTSETSAGVKLFRRNCSVIVKRLKEFWL